MAESGRNGRSRRRRSTASGRKEVRVNKIHGGSLVDPGVLLQVIPPPETFGTDGTRERTQSGVDAFVAGQLLIPRERLAAGFLLAFERPLA